MRAQIERVADAAPGPCRCDEGRRGIGAG